jgi:anti-anti-sigma factor
MITSGAATAFGIEASFLGFEAVLTVQGEVDLGTAPELGAYLDEAIDNGHRFVVVDLSGLEFIDGSGLRVIASRAERLTLSGGALTVRAPSPMVRRLLDIVGLSDQVRVEQPEESSRTSDSKSYFAVPSPAGGSAGLAEYLRRVASVPPNNEVVNSALRLVVALSRATVGGADGVSVSLLRNGRLSTVAASDQTILDMDAGQYETGEGPCVDASLEGRRFYAEFLDEELRWPAFTPKARSLGINSILSSPLIARNTPVGALNIYSRTPSAFADMDQNLASAFADEASVILSEAQADVTDVQLDDRLGEALRTRELISQAQGVIMGLEGVGQDDAYTILRRHSLRHGRSLRERAEEILAAARRPRLGARDLLREMNDG